MCVCLRVCKGVRTPPNRPTSPFRAGQRPAVCFLLLYFTPRLFLPLLVLRGGSVLYRQPPPPPPLLLSTLQSDWFEHRARERKERRGRSELFGQTDAPGRMWRFAALWVCRIGPATQTHTHNRRGRAKSPFLTHTLILQPHTLSSSSRSSTHCPPLTSSLWLHPTLPRS